MKRIRDKFQTNYLIGILEKNFKNVPFYCSQSQYSVSDCLLSAFAICHLKFPSLLSFDEAYKDPEDEVVR
jgi:hypothetical protein